MKTMSCFTCILICLENLGINFTMITMHQEVGFLQIYMDYHPLVLIQAPRDPKFNSVNATESHSLMVV